MFHETKEFKMFKKSLLAASVLLVSANSMAATSATTSAKIDVFGKEFISLDASVAFSTIEVDVDAQYSAGDIITLSVTGASFDTTKSAAQAAYTDNLTTSPTMTLGLLSTEAGKVTFRVTAATGNHGDTEAGKFSKITFSGLQLTTATAKVAGSISAVYSAQTSTGIAIDASSKNTVVAMKGVNQFNSVVTTKLNETVSVGSLRKNFGGSPTVVYSDTVESTFTNYTLAATEAAATGLMAAAMKSTKTTLNGNFSFLDTSGDGKLTSADKITSPFVALAGSTATAITPATGLQSVSYAGPTAFGAKSGLTITAGNVAGDTTITDQTFTVDHEITYTTNKGSDAKATNSVSGGVWGLDGSKDDIAFLPFGSDYAQSITVTNLGTVAGTITVTLTAEGKEYTKVLTATAAADTVTNISSEVSAFAAASGITGNASVNIVVNAPSTDRKSVV